MAVHGISGIWKSNGVITHYAIHTKTGDTFTRAIKTTKAEAIRLLEITGSSASTWTWNYTKASWTIQEKVEVINGSNGKYLRSNPDDKLTDNLGHLIDFETIAV